MTLHIRPVVFDYERPYQARTSVLTTN